MAKPPSIDARTAPEIAWQVKKLLAVYLPSNQQLALLADNPDPIGEALVGVFARHAEIIIQRLNEVPNKNFLAFLDLLGASRLPPAPARVALTFSLAVGSAADGLVPPGTAAAAPPPPGEKESVLFETEQELVVTAATLASWVVHNPLLDQYADYGAIATSPDLKLVGSTSAPLVFQGNRAVAHHLYLGQRELLGFPNIAELSLSLNLLKPLGDGAVLSWEWWDGIGWQPQNLDAAGNLNQGNVVILNFGSRDPVPLSLVNGQENRWLRCRLVTPITPTLEAHSSMVRVTELPEIGLPEGGGEPIQFLARLNRRDLPIEQAFTNQIPVDLSKDFLPLGEKPKFGDTFYLTNREALSLDAARVMLTIIATNADSGVPAANPSRDLRLRWEFWDGDRWELLGISGNNGAVPPARGQPIPNEFADTTEGLKQSGTVSFRLPRQPQITSVNGVEQTWLRLRLVAGNYGAEAQYVPSNPDRLQDGYRLVPATLFPPSLQAIQVSYEATRRTAPDQILTYNQLEYREILTVPRSTSFSPFWIEPDHQQLPLPSLYLGFALPASRTDFPNRPLSLFFQTADLPYGEKTVPLSPTQSQQVGRAGTDVLHQFWLTNPTPEPIRVTVTIAGTHPNQPWTRRLRFSNTLDDDPRSSPLTLTLAPGEVRSFWLQVTIPADALTGSGDRGYLNVTTLGNLPLENGPPETESLDVLPPEAGTLSYNASFETVVGDTLPIADRLQLVWQYWNGAEWSRLNLEDGTENLTRPGVVKWLPPDDFIPRPHTFGQPPRYWLRVQWSQGQYAVEPRLIRLLLNTTLASQTITLRDEILGSSDGSAHQTFRTIRTPVLQGQRLDVRESELPPAAEQEELRQIAQQTGDAGSAIAYKLDTTNRPQEIWVRWREVEDFYGSGARDRHYIINHLTGEIRFGDGLNGLIPPLGRGNLRLTRYCTGGGNRGNQPAGAIGQLKTTLPYVEKVTNWVAATGGADAEALDLLIDRAPRTIRHGNRAVTLEDYQDLAMLASPAVARARCFPGLNLEKTPFVLQNPAPRHPYSVGDISVIIVPRSPDPKPLPRLELTSRVQDYLEARSIPTARVWVVGPLYVRVQVSVEIALVSLEGSSTVVQAVDRTLTSFLHPLTGGLEKTGWNFGREPYPSDFYALIEAVPGVDHIRSLVIDDGSDRQAIQAIKATERFLVYSGKHTIRIRLRDEN